jgi:hypothetical protein
VNPWGPVFSFFADGRKKKEKVEREWGKKESEKKKGESR